MRTGAQQTQGVAGMQAGIAIGASVLYRKNGISCSNATSSDCEALGEQYVDADPNTWPAGCLVQVAAKCMDDLDAYGCGSGAEKYTTHANSTEQCLEDAKKMGASVRRHPHSLCHCRSLATCGFSAAVCLIHALLWPRCGLACDCWAAGVDCLSMPRWPCVDPVRGL